MAANEAIACLHALNGRHGKLCSLRQNYLIDPKKCPRSAKADGLWTRAHIGNNVLAGIVVGVVALPLAMAFAIASGARPEQGLYTAIVAAVMTSLFGGTLVQISGPTAHLWPCSPSLPRSTGLPVCKSRR
jgi:hypothetical protein